MKLNRRNVIAAGLMLAGSMAVSGSAYAEGGRDYFKGKTVNFIVATEPGGGYDTYGRLLTEYMAKILPETTFVVRNMPGAGHLIATNYIYASKPDGLTIGTFNTGLIYAQLKKDPAARFDLTKMSWVGKMASDPRVFMTSKESGITSFEQLMALKEPIRFAAGGVGSAATVETEMLIKILNLPINLITGYNGNEALLAMKRGEVQGQMASKSSLELYVDENGGSFIAEMGGDGTDIPKLSDMVEGETAQQAVALVESQVNVVRLVAGPPNIPADILKTLQEVFEEALSNKDLLEKAHNLKMPIDYLIGEDVGNAVAEALNQPQEIIDLVAK